jgi:anti-sigma factor RsiW
MTPRRPHHVPPEWLAAYADGELSPEDRVRVELWLADNLEARELLEAQESLGPTNTEFWETVRPPTPSPTGWANTVRRIASGGPAAPRRRWAGWLGTAALLATAATLLLALPAGERATVPWPASPIVGPDSCADEEPYQMAQDEDVRIVSLPEEAADFLVVGRHPLGDSIVVLAGREELAVHNMGVDPAGRAAEMFDDADGAVVWAPKDE